MCSHRGFCNTEATAWARNYECARTGASVTQELLRGQGVGHNGPHVGPITTFRFDTGANSFCMVQMRALPPALSDRMTRDQWLRVGPIRLSASTQETLCGQGREYCQSNRFG